MPWSSVRVLMTSGERVSTEGASDMTSQNGHKRAVLYARVSSDEQAKGYSLPTQLEACQKYAESAGYSVAATFQDDYTGTAPIEQRPEGRAATPCCQTATPMR